MVKLIKINKQFDENDLSLGNRAPQIGDVATIVEVYDTPGLGYELECSDKNGITEWLVSFSSEDAEFELINEII